jgi:fructuronate reductase
VTTTDTPTLAALPRLTRARSGARPAGPVRIVHLGLGGFFRAHQAWYTDRAPDAAGWGIAAFTGRSPRQAQALDPQDGLYTLATKDRDGDRYEVVASLSAVHAASDHDAFLGYLRSPAVALVTLTVTEAGYHRGADGALDVGHPDVAADLAALTGSLTAQVSTVPGRLVAGLAARREAGAGPLAVVPCDNLSDNGSVARRVVLDLAGRVDAGLRAWIKEQVSFVTTMVDRITPRTTDEDRAAVTAATGFADASPVVTEPFAEWVVSGNFPAGRPRWEDAGVTFVDDVRPFEARKLFLLNGSHSLLAYAGSLRGHTTVAEAIADPTCRAWVHQWWEEASRHLAVPEESIAAYRSALLGRFGNGAIRHLLAQIAADGSQKLPVRVAPVLRAERAAGRMPDGAVRIVAAWLLHLRGRGAPVEDAGASSVLPQVRGDLLEAAERAVAAVVPELGADRPLVAAVADAARELDR